MLLHRTAVLLLLAVAACKESAPAKGPIEDSAGLASKASNLEVTATDQSFKLRLPARWAGVFRTDTLSTDERGLARPGAMNVVYLPQDTSVIPQTLIVVAVYDSAAWVKVKAEGGPPPGDSLLSKNSRVYVLSLPQSNPFTPGSVDAMKFDSLTIKAADKATLISVP